MTTETKIVDELHAAIEKLMNGNSIDYWPRSQLHGGGFASCFRIWLQARYPALYKRAVDFIAVNHDRPDPVTTAVERYGKFPAVYSATDFGKPRDQYYTTMVSELIAYVECRYVVIPITDQDEETVLNDVQEYLRCRVATEELADMTELLSKAIKCCFK